MFTTEWTLHQKTELTEREIENLESLENLKDMVSQMYKVDSSKLENRINNVFGNNINEIAKPIYKKKIEELYGMLSVRPYDKVEACYLECIYLFKNLLVEAKKAKSVDDININDFKNYQVKFNSCGGGLYTRNDGLINKCNELVYHIETFIEYHSLYHTLLSYINIDEVKKGLIEMFSEQYSDFKTIEEILVKEYKMPTMKDAVERYGEMFTNYGDNIIEDARKELINLIKQALKINKNDKLKLNDVDLELLPRSIKGKPDNITRSIDEIYTLSAIRVYNREFMEKYNKAMTYEVD
jgi:hypothetical protein